MYALYTKAHNLREFLVYFRSIWVFCRKKHTRNAFLGKRVNNTHVFYDRKRWSPSPLSMETPTLCPNHLQITPNNTQITKSETESMCFATFLREHLRDTTCFATFLQLFRRTIHKTIVFCAENNCQVAALLHETSTFAENVSKSMNRWFFVTCMFTCVSRKGRF